MLQRIDHVNISVTDLEQSKKFYIDLLGFTLLKEGHLKGEWIDQVVGLKNVDAFYVQLSLPGSSTCLELIQYHSPVGKRAESVNQSNLLGLRHMAFAVEDIELVYRKLKEANVPVFSEIQIYNQKKKLCYFWGPDSVILELCEYLD